MLNSVSTAPDSTQDDLLQQAIEQLLLSAHAYGRILTVAPTIAEQATAEKIEALTSSKPSNTAA